MDVELKRCNCCRRWKGAESFNSARDAYTGEAKWLRNTCNRCLNGRRRAQQRINRESAAEVKQLALL